jgi:undecaprenyl-diphosphatase
VTAVARWIGRLDARDRGMLVRYGLRDSSNAALRGSWIALTYLGSAPVAVGAALLPLGLPHWPRRASIDAAIALAASHLVVQITKHMVSRARPPLPALIRCPDRFSFPSGHATAALAVTLSYALAFPALAGPLVVLGLLVGASRVVLRVHYPGDVFVGQLAAILAVFGAHALR